VLLFRARRRVDLKKKLQRKILGNAAEEEKGMKRDRLAVTATGGNHLGVAGLCTHIHVHAHIRTHNIRIRIYKKDPGKSVGKRLKNELPCFPLSGILREASLL
jgi:hypothetical protein